MTSSVLFLAGALLLIVVGSLIVWAFSRSSTRPHRPGELSVSLKAALPRQEQDPPSGVTILPPADSED